MRKEIATVAMTGLVILGLAAPATAVAKNQLEYCNQLYSQMDESGGKVGGYYQNCKLNPVYITYRLTSDKPNDPPHYHCFQAIRVPFRLGDYESVIRNSIVQGDNCWN